MSVVVTGGLGFIGHKVVQLLKTQGHHIVIVDNRTTYGIIPQYELDYLLQEREFVKTKENIYKVGMTQKENYERFNQYPKGSVLLFQMIYIFIK